MNKDAQVIKLDDAYLTAEELSKYINDRARTLTESLEKTINNMKLHWHGEDATLHINAWIEKYIKVAYHFQELTAIGKVLQNYFVILQTGRAQLGNNKKIGDQNTNKYFYNPITKVEITTEYYYDEQLKNDFITLEEFYDLYKEFVDKVDLNIEKILLNWKIGKLVRAKLIKRYQKSFIYSKDLLVEIDELIMDLAKALQNINKINNETRE